MTPNVWQNTAVMLRTQKRCGDRRYERQIFLRRATQTIFVSNSIERQL